MPLICDFSWSHTSGSTTESQCSAGGSAASRGPSGSSSGLGASARPGARAASHCRKSPAACA
eukprot:7914638-Heterocapsa_arctica.AAC.1